MKNLILALFVLSIGGAFAQPATRNGRIFLTKDRGVNWELADKGFPVNDQVNAWLFKDGVVIAGTNENGIMISSDKMGSWHSIVKGLPKKASIISLAVHRNIVFAGTRMSGVFSSYDDGETWESCNIGLSNHAVRALLSDGPVILAGTNNGIYSSSDNGKTWTPGITGLQINDFASYQGQVFAATNKGLMVADQAGTNWKSVYNMGAVYRVNVTGRKIYTLAFDGAAFQSDIPMYIWLKTELFIPFDSTFKLTPASVKFFKAEWKNSLRNADIDAEAGALPEELSFTELLDTPFGIVAAARAGGC